MNLSLLNAIKSAKAKAEEEDKIEQEIISNVRALKREDPQPPTKRALRAIASNALAAECQTSIRVIDVNALEDVSETARFNYTTDAVSF